MPALLQVRSQACVTCSEPADLYCSNCQVTPYCSTRCQLRDWSGRHRTVCHNLARLSETKDIRLPALDIEPKIQSPAPLRRPHAFNEHTRERSQKRDDDTDTKVSDKSNRSEHFRRLQERTQNHRSSPGQDKRQAATSKGGNQQNSQKNFTPNQAENKNFQQRANKQKPAQKPDTPAAAKKTEIKPDVNEPKPEKSDAKSSPVQTSPTNEQKTSQTIGAKQEAPSVKPASLGDVTPTRKVVPKNYLVQLLSIGDTVFLSVDAKASECRSPVGDYVCLSMHEKYEPDYQSLCEDYVVVCDADQQEHKLVPGEACSYFNVEDGGWYRARCLSPAAIALLDGSKVVAVTAADKIRKLPPQYEQLPEFSCVLECNNTEVGANLKCLLVSKLGDGFKVTLEDMESGSQVGEGVVTRWTPTVEYAPVKPLIPEVPRPPVSNNSKVLLVDATALHRAFVRPSDTRLQAQHDDVVHNVLLAGRKASPLKEPPAKGQTVIAKFTDGLHYRALCRRTNVAQNKYLLEYIDYGNEQVCRNLEDLYPCPPNLDLAAAPTQVSMIKLSSAGGELTPPAAEYIEKLKDSIDEMILTLPSGEATAPSGSEVVLKLAKNSEDVNKRVIEMCTPEWQKFQDRGGDVVEIEPLMFWDLEYQDLPAGPLELDILDSSVLEGGMISGCVKGDPHAQYVFTHLTQKMADYCNSEIGREPYLPKVEELCIAQYPPHPQWFRAVLMEQVAGAGGALARVCYVDYGNVEQVPVTLLRKMLPEFVRAVPVLGSHFEIEDFPKDPSPEAVAAARAHLRVTGAGRGSLRAARCRRLEQGFYRITAPDLIRAMTL